MRRKPERLNVKKTNDKQKMCVQARTDEGEIDSILLKMR